MSGSAGRLQGVEACRLPCFLCGECCSRFQVRLEADEARRIARELGLGWDEFLDKCIDPRWPGTESFLLRHVAGGCLFLDRDPIRRTATCRIHAFKPSACQEWQASPEKPECCDGLMANWGLTVTPSGRVQGPDATVQEFRSFLEELG